MSEFILELKDVVKTFGGVTALDGVQFQLKRGEIHALMGENGAGKSTFIKVITRGSSTRQWSDASGRGENNTSIYRRFRQTWNRSNLSARYGISGSFCYGKHFHGTGD